MADEAATAAGQVRRVGAAAAAGASKLGGVLAARAAAAESVNRRDPRRLGLILAQLAALCFLIHHFRLESTAFFNLTVLTGVGFFVHYFLPLRQRLPFFVLLSLAGCVLVLGAEQAAWLVGLGLAVLGIAHLPLGLAVRSALLIAAGIGLAGARVVLPRMGLHMPWSEAVWPILGSMFVFRLIAYLYDASHGAGAKRPSQVLGYFFLLPNVCFPLFPVVDFKKFCTNYYDAERHGIYQTGVEWMWRGLVQLICYRVVYYHLVLDPVEVTDVADLALYMLSTIALYIRISGYFHLVVGMLHLFGFNLPATNHQYFLASSFTDFWRRINIYWKDFMMKVFYYPAYFRLRKGGETRALVLATLFTFVVTWFLHAVQWFWIRGEVFLAVNDILFWSLFAALMLANSLYENKYGRARSLSPKARTLGESVGIAARTVGTFAVICTLWSFWSSESATDWVLMMRGALRLPAWSAVQMAGSLAVVAGSAALLVLAVARGWRSETAVVAPRRSAATILASTVVLCIVSSEAVTARMPKGEAVASLRWTSLNRRDMEHFQRGYYENLVEVRRFNRELQRVYRGEARDFNRSLEQAGISRKTNDELEYELIPGSSGSFYGVTVQINRWGMRYGECSRQRPPGAYRFAVVGPSIAMGSGVAAEDTFTSLLEARLNGEKPADSARARYEVLNFGIAGYTPLQQMYQIRRTVLSFEPNALLYVGQATEAESAALQLHEMYWTDPQLPDDYLQQLVARTGIRRTPGRTEVRRRMLPVRYELLEWVYRNIVSDCRERHVLPVYVYFEMANDRSQPWRAPDRRAVIDLARRTGFTVLDLSGVYGDHTIEALSLVENDGHPNELGQRLIAERLYELLREHSGELGLGLDTVPPSNTSASNP